MTDDTSADETAIVPPPTEAAPELAWSLDDDADPVPVERQSWALTCGQAAVFLSVGVVGWVLLRAHQGPPNPQRLPPAAHPAPVVARPSSSPPASTVTIRPAAPPTVTVGAAPTTVTLAAPSMAIAAPRTPAVSAPRGVDPVNDQRFLDKMRSLGYTITDPQLAVRNAHETCRLFQLGESVEQVNRQMSAQMGANMTDTLELTSSAILAYLFAAHGAELRRRR
jgi:hypothetical protein